MKRLLTGLTALAVIASCDSGPLGPSSTSNSADGLMLSVAVSRSQLRAGDLDSITITLANTNDHAVSLNFSSGCQILPYIADGRGTTVLPSGGWACTAMLSRLDLAVGERRTVVLVWSGSTTFASEMPLRPLPSGVYTVFAALSAQELHLATPSVSVRLL